MFQEEFRFIIPPVCCNRLTDWRFLENDTHITQIQAFQLYMYYTYDIVHHLYTATLQFFQGFET